MKDAMAIRIDEKTRERIGRAAKRKGTTRSEIVRIAIMEMLQREEKDGPSPYELVKDLVGSVHGGDPCLSVDTGRKVEKMLLERAAR